MFGRDFGFILQWPCGFIHSFINSIFGMYLLFEDAISEMRRQNQVKVEGLAMQIKQSWPLAVQAHSGIITMEGRVLGLGFISF